MKKQKGNTMNTNDDKIMLLKEEIAKKQAAIKKSSKFIPRTNCALPHEGRIINIHTLSTTEAIVPILVAFNSTKMSAENLNLVDQYMLNGYNLLDWVADLTSKLEYVNRNSELAKLKAMEDKLTKLLSEDKKTAMELDEIEKLVKG